MNVPRARHPLVDTRPAFRGPERRARGGDPGVPAVGRRPCRHRRLGRAVRPELEFLASAMRAGPRLLAVTKVDIPEWRRIVEIDERHPGRWGFPRATVA